jgi:hypothetical protein
VVSGQQLVVEGWPGLLTMKWSHRIAQGFSPGWTSPKTALKWRPSKAVSSSTTIPNCSLVRNIPALIQRHTFGRHFQGDLEVLPHPGLKPWAILLDHFMVMNTDY